MTTFIHDTWDEEWVSLDDRPLLDPEVIAQLWRCYNTKRNTMQQSKVLPWSFPYPLFSTTSGFFPDGTNASHVRTKRSRRYGGEEFKRLWLYLLSKEVNSLMRQIIIDETRYLWATGDEEDWDYTPFPGYLEDYEYYYLSPELWHTMVEQARTFFDSLDMLATVDANHVVKVTITTTEWHGTTKTYTPGAWTNNVLYGKVDGDNFYIKTSWNDLGSVTFEFDSTPTISTSVHYAIVEDINTWINSGVGVSKVAVTELSWCSTTCTAFTEAWYESWGQRRGLIEVDPPNRIEKVREGEVPLSANFSDNPFIPTRAWNKKITLEAVDWLYGETYNVTREIPEPPYTSSVIGTLTAGGTFDYDLGDPDRGDKTVYFEDDGWDVGSGVYPNYDMPFTTAYGVKIAPEFTTEKLFAVARSNYGGYNFVYRRAAIDTQYHESEAYRIRVVP